MASISKIQKAAKLGEHLTRGGLYIVDGYGITHCLPRKGRPAHTVVFPGGQWIRKEWSPVLGKYQQVDAGKVVLS